MPHPLRRAAAIVGAGESDEIGFIEGRSSLQLHAEAVRNAVADAGVRWEEIDGIFATGGSGRFPAAALAEYLGIRPRYMDSTQMGGSSFLFFVHHALAAIATGEIEVAVISHGECGFSGPRRGGRGTGGAHDFDPWDPGELYERLYGAWGAPAFYAHAMNRYMHRFGATKEDFARIAVVTREWATLNPRAVMHSKETHPYGGPIDVETVIGSRVIAWPLSLLDCCLVTDHGAAVVLTTPERARSLRHPPVWVEGAGEALSHMNMSQMEDFTATSARDSAARAYRMAGMGPGEMEMAMIYDSFTYTAAVTAEMLGLTPRGEGASLWAGDAARPGGRLPVNTNGGGLSFSHSGMYGMMLLVEAQRQLARTAVGLPGRQVEARSAVVNGTGGSLSTTATLVLTAD